LRLVAALALCGAALLTQAQVLTSARGTADRIAELLAAGDIEAVAALSNQPQRRKEELLKYRALVGEAEFRRVFTEYLRRPIREEYAVGAHRLVIRDIVDPAGKYVGQYFVERDGTFLMDDEPSPARERLRAMLLDYGKPRPSGRKD
jgi:hypothetical protein